MALSPSPLLVYIHGFNSSPSSYKAVKLGQWLTDHDIVVDYHVPHLSPYPNQAIQQLTELLQEQGEGRLIYLIGSSLGGFYASYLTDRFSTKTVLINPSVEPYETLTQYLGENVNFHTGETYTFTPAHADDLRKIAVDQFEHPEKVWVLVQTGDEVLDFRQAANKFFRSPCAIEYGGDHGFQGFDNWIVPIMHFFDPRLVGFNK